MPQRFRCQARDILLTHPTFDLLADLGLHGMAKALRELADNPEAAALGHVVWVSASAADPKI